MRRRHNYYRVSTRPIPNRSPTALTTITDIFGLPERVHQGDFVLRLSDGLERAGETLHDYVMKTSAETPKRFESADI